MPAALISKTAMSPANRSIGGGAGRRHAGAEPGLRRVFPDDPAGDRVHRALINGAGCGPNRAVHVVFQGICHL